MKSPNMPSQETPTTSDSSRFSKKWIWGAIGIASALALGVAVSRRGLPFRLRKENGSEKSALPTTITAEWQLIEKIDRALQKSHIEGIEVYVKNGKVLLVAPPEQQHDLLDARDLIRSLDGVQSVETSVKSSSQTSPTIL
jgi:nitrate reductase NapAB chaperone NapD